MKKREMPTKGEELLAQVLEECLEEDLSFVPPEREIARTHRFSAAFEEKMQDYFNSQQEEHRQKAIRRHFAPRYGYLAACILVFCICGALLYGILGQQGMRIESADTPMAAAGEEAEAEEAAPAEAGEDTGSGTASSEARKESREYCGQTVYPAPRQDVPEALDYVTTLVNCPVQDEENPILYLTIGNVGEETIRYSKDYSLEVWLEDGWYVIPQKDAGTAVWTEEGELEAGMAMDEEIDLSHFQMSYDAERYRMVVQVNGELVGAEFTFEETFSEQMEAQETAGE